MPRTLAEAARRLNARPARRPRKAALPYLVLMTDPRQGDPVAVAARLPRGAAVVLRHYDDPNRRALGKRLAALCRRRGLVLLVAGDWRLAAALGADGLHLPEGEMRHGRLAGAVGWRRRRGGLLSAAAHGAAALVLARRFRADMAVVSPVFPTRSHPGAGTLGPARFAALCQRSGIACLALGGVTADTVSALMGAGAWGIAAIDGWGTSVSSPPNPRSASRPPS